MKSRFRKLETETVPLSGIRLIEAGAGTGKTTTITGIYLRLILEKKLMPENILVVTFTRAATDELKERIRRTLMSAKRALSGEKQEDSPAARLAARYADPPDALINIQDALGNMDQAAIFTIHGFCQRLLTEFAFETRTPFEAELTTDPFPLIKAVSEDFWRRNFYEAPLEFLAHFRDRISGPENFADLLMSCRIPSISVIPGPFSAEPIKPDAFRKAFKRLKEIWQVDRGEIVDLLKSPSLNANKYGGIQSKKAGDGESPRTTKVLSFADIMDRYLATHSIGFPIPKEAEKFSADYVHSATKKNQEPPSHPFFDACDEMLRSAALLIEMMERTLLSIRRRFLVEAQPSLSEKKRGGAVQFYDDLLIGVHEALHGPWGPDLVRSVSKRYRAALVDEFQDTDTVQYDIFSRLFETENAALFLIGDPKQAIYGFRGADIFAYLQAASNASLRYTLTENWRSSPQMIAAANALFSGHPAPFVFDGIPFHSAQPGGEKEDKGNKDQIADPAMHLWFFPGEEKNGKRKPLPKTVAVYRIANAVADEIVHLLSSEMKKETAPKRAPTKAGSIAVLVRTNRQARIVKKALSDRQVPSVLFHSDHLFDTREATEVQTVLLAIAEPSNDIRYRAALATVLLGTSADAFELFSPAPLWWESRLETFFEYRRIWRDKGFMPMFHALLREEKIRQRLIALEDGERRLTNILHLAEVLHRTAQELHLEMGGLLKWFNEMLDPSAPRPLEEQLRLESDDDAVKIVTIHKSKGLEYDIVFCPFCWEGVQPSKGDVLFHDPKNRKRLTLDIGSDNWEENAKRSATEELAENIRLLYVAVTRSKYRCYLAWGELNTADTSAMAYLFHFKTTPGEATDLIQGLKHFMTDLDENEKMKDLQIIADRSKGALLIEIKEDAVSKNVSSQPKPYPPLTVRTFTETIRWPWRITSYSALASQTGQEEVLPDHDIATLVENDNTDSGSRPDREKIESRDFPKGARAGIFFHELLEKLNFMDAAAEDDATRSRLDAMVVESLGEHGFQTAWSPLVCRMLRNIVTLPFGEGKNAWTLAQVDEKNRINEMGFYFPIKRQSVHAINRIMKDSGVAGNLFPETAENVETAILPGYLKGYIDMIFRAGDRFFVLDWKSNYLGDDIEDYKSDRLARVMQEEQYLLQYYLYVVATDKYLKSRIPGYRYETHFGGVLYVFLRGVTTKKGDGYGIYRDCPSPEVIDRLQQVLTG